MPPRPTTLFISHASEDKVGFVRPLAHALKKRGLRVWYDEFSLKLGDSLRRSIDGGLVECTAGVVVLSHAFFSKEWPQRELDALYSSEVAGRTRILPIWHEVDASFVGSISPLLADRYAISSSQGVDEVAAVIASQFPPSTRYTGIELARILKHQQSTALFALEALGAGCRYRFLQMNAFKEEYQEIFDTATSKLSDEEVENFPSQLDRWLEDQHERLRIKHKIPEDAYLTSDEPVREQHLGSFTEDIERWASGTLSRHESARLVHDLDLQELDEYFILLNIPNFSFSSAQRELLEMAIVELGCSFDDGYNKVGKLCERLLTTGDDA
jgi:hypothetical protein